MAELLALTLATGKKVVHMVKTAKDCADEAVELSQRVQSTLDLMQQAVPTFEDNGFLRKGLIELTALFESIHRLLQLCVPAPRIEQQRQHISSTLGNAVHIAKRFCFSEQNLQTLKDYTEKLDRIALHFSGPMQLVAKQQTNRMEETLLAMQITLDERSDPSLKLAKRWLKGNMIDSELVELEEPLGRGSFGVVMAGKYYGQPVAIKRALNSVMSAEDRDNFRREASTHFALRHDRIVQVIAFRTGGGSRPPCLVMERMDRTLYHFLGDNPSPLELSSSLPYMIDICEGLAFLHQSGVLHRDIKSSNILLCDGGAKVADFGLAHVCSTIGQTTGNASFLAEKAGTKFWMAPEVLKWGKSSFDSDIFSLHVVLWEIIENRQGGRGLAIGEVLLDEGHLEKLPIQGEGAETDPARERLNKLVRSCGQLERERRPKIGNVLAVVKDIYDSLSAPGGAEEPGATTGSPLQGSQGASELPLRPSDTRRQKQERMASKSSGGSWENWKSFDPSRVGVETPGAQEPGVAEGGVEAVQPEGNPSRAEARSLTTSQRVEGGVSEEEASLARAEEVLLSIDQDIPGVAILMQNIRKRLNNLQAPKSPASDETTEMAFLRLSDNIAQLEARIESAVGRVEEDTQGMAHGVEEIRMQLEGLQPPNYPYPHLVVIQAVQAEGTRSLWSRFRGVFVMDLTLHFLCPFDMSEVPCGFGGNGYRLRETRGWVKKISPAQQVAVATAKVALKAAAGVDELVLSDFLHDVRTGSAEELVHATLDEDVLSRVISGDEDVRPDMQRETSSSYEALKYFMTNEEAKRRKKARDGDGYIDFRHRMQRVGNGKGGLVWVRNENVQRWLDLMT